MGPGWDTRHVGPAVVKPRAEQIGTGDPPPRPSLRSPVAALLSVCLCAADSDERAAQGPPNNKQTLPHFPNVGEGRHKGGAIPLVAGLNAAEVQARWGGGGATPPVVPRKKARGGGAPARLFCFPLNCHKSSFSLIAAP